MSKHATLAAAPDGHPERPPLSLPVSGGGCGGVASGATILGPCAVGRNSVAAAGAVVTGDVPDYAVVAGVPARQIATIP